MRQARVARLHGRHERVHDLALDPVRQVPRVRDVGKPAPAVGNLLVLGERVGDEREQAQVGAEGFGKRIGGRFTLFIVGVLQQIERRLDRQRLAVHLEARRRDGLVEQAVPGRIARHGFFVEQLFELVVELIGLFLADVLDPRPVMPEGRVGHRALERRIVDAVELEREEEHVERRRRDALLNIAEELRPRGVGGVAGMDQRRIGDQSSEQFLDALVALDRRRKGAPRVRLGRETGEAARISLLEGRAFGARPFKIARDFGRVHSGI